ncbi:hypothetical protein M8998_07430 [Sphingobacterium sp. lm-10]|uniref:hypothetical protein n=1 Tax=Sphingobacterium sp. lm-10 TaxID=2944904 RepID=UPI00202289D5|nr:hypothetical protein [Sphingobacterium sp. lm-10]MCL7987766.1 hypothetical protein [Sphingobacterium sp. lm-10]
MIEITDKVPSPVKTKLGGIMEKLEVGQSFPIEYGREKQARQEAWNLFHRINPTTNLPMSEKKFTVRRDPNDVANFRCWREE